MTDPTEILWGGIGSSDDKRFLYQFPSLFPLTLELQNFCGK